MDDDATHTNLPLPKIRRATNLKSSAKLELVKGPGSPRLIDMTRSAFVVGRGGEADVIINSETLSRTHFQLNTDRRGAVTCTDMNSRNGIFCNGVRVESVVLRNGDALQAGHVLFIFHEAR